MEFHIARSLRDKLDLKDVIFSYTGNVVFGSVVASRRVADGLNLMRGKDPLASSSVASGSVVSGSVASGSLATGAVNGGALYAMGLIDELSHAMVARYRREIDPEVTAEAMRWFETRLGKAEVDRLLLAFVERFPGTTVYSGTMTATKWLAGQDETIPNREAALEELMMLWLANLNPAFKVFRELFDDEALKEQTQYTGLTGGLAAFFATRPLVSATEGTLLDALQAPMKAAPDSLVEQLEFIRKQWAPYLGEQLQRALLAIDVVREEDVAIWMRFHPAAPGAGHEMGWQAQGFVGDEYVGFEEDFVVGADGVRRRRTYATDHQAPLVEYEAFSADYAWMPTVVMMAKNTYVWLEQLSKKYLRHIHRLDQIPDEELRLLADRGMTALWLIGLWERSVASKTIKRLRGQADAVASAYSLKEYNIADDLGGNAAYEVLRDRAAAYGLRLASDMVPNHMGIDSPWVIEHPEWFVARDEPPFPSYSYNGPDLSPDSRAEIKLEDHYYDMSDAAVAFKLRTYDNNRTQYLYHGNDGTTFAWNDTAQLDYSKAAVREHVMQVILHVARLFPIIRFDAAMVLAKRHVQRLWFPLPGVGGSIPSRAENAMSQEEFDALMPNEFWREVVDRVAVEVPGTLLLAEAFWLLEGYFVRTLGMHRVYNSAFMNMLRDEENAKYRSYLKKTVEFDPDIMKRYVNFMSNPDERTAIDQFGDGDKYFGTCVLLATLPGLPMFAHGQIEGFGERYGMDFKEARVQETPNEGLIARYQREITPLLRTRWLFAGSEHFVLYDYWNGHGTVDENVIAYSNREGDARAVILYNNVYGSTQGTIHVSAASVDKGSGQLVQRSLTQALGLPGEDGMFVAYRDTVQGLEFLRRATDLRDNGLTVGLRGYQYIVLQNWREMHANVEHPWDRVCDRLQGAGVSSLDEAMVALKLQPLHDALRLVAGDQNAAWMEKAAVRAVDKATPTPVKTQPLVTDDPGSLHDVSPDPDRSIDPSLDAGFAASFEKFYEQFTEFSPVASTDAVQSYGKRVHERVESVLAVFGGASAESVHWAPLLVWTAMTSLPATVDRQAAFDRFKLRETLGNLLVDSGMEYTASWRAAAMVRVALAAYGVPEQALTSEVFWGDGDVRWLMGVHEAEGITYFSKEGLEEMLSWLATIASIEGHAADNATLQALRQRAAIAGYQQSAFLRGEDEMVAVAAVHSAVPTASTSPVYESKVDHLKVDVPKATASTPLALKAVEHETKQPQSSQSATETETTTAGDQGRS